MPFGFRLAADTLPSGELQKGGCRSALAVSGFRFRARLGFSIPSFSLRPARHYPRFRIQRPSSGRRRDFNPPEQRAAQRTLPVSLTSPARASSASAVRLPDAAASAYRRRRSSWKSPGSRAKSVRACQVLRPRRVARALAIAHTDVLPSATQTASATDACARLGDDVVRYSFIAGDLHPLLLAGLPAQLCENERASEQRGTAQRSEYLSAIMSGMRTSFRLR